MPNPISDIAKTAVRKIRQIADTVEAYSEAAARAAKPVEPESLAADLLEKLAAALRSKKKP